MRNFRGVLWFLVGVLLVGVPMFAFAETIAATGTPRTGQVYPWKAQSYNKFGTVALAVCKSLVTNNCASPANCYLNPNGSNWSCYNNGSYVDNIMANTASVCIDTDPGGAVTCTGTVYSCPSGQNWTLSGSSCTRPDCVSPEVRNPANGVCGPPPCPVAGASAGSSTSVYSGSGQIGAGGLCISSCGATASGGCESVHAVGGSWSFFCKGPFVATGSNCTGNATATPPNDPAYDCAQKGMGSGTVNGTVVCVAADGSQQQTTDKTTTTNQPKDASNNPTGPATTTSEDKTKTTTCDGGQCTTTTTTTTTNPDGTKTTTTASEAQDKKSFCEENPTVSICKNGTFAGSCGAAPKCDGDAIQCAQAAAAFKIQCNMETEPSDAAYTLGKAIAGGGADPAGNPLSQDKWTNVDVGAIVTAAAGERTLTATCIASPSFTVRGQTHTLPTTLFCQFASIVGYLMIAVSSVIAVRMVAS